MKNNDAEVIGVFDSGLGGLSVLQELKKELPNADFIYFGDTKYAPYGDRTQAEIGALTSGAFRLLHKRGATHIVTACNSVSTILMKDFLDLMGLDENNLVEMSRPLARHIEGGLHKVLVLATSATVKSGMYSRALKGRAEVEEVALPGLVDLIEAGAPREEILAFLRKKLANLDASKYDRAILGCTHFPLVQDVFEEVLQMRIINPAIAVAKFVKEKEWGKNGEGKLTFILSKDSQVFREKVKEMFSGDFNIVVK